MKTFQQYVENRINYSGLPKRQPDPKDLRGRWFDSLGNGKFGHHSPLPSEQSPDVEPYVGLPEPEHVQKEKRLQDLRNRSRTLTPEERIELSQLLQAKAATEQSPPPPAVPYQKMPDSPELQRTQEIERLKALGSKKTMADRIKLADLLSQKGKEEYEYDNIRNS